MKKLTTLLGFSLILASSFSCKKTSKASNLDAAGDDQVSAEHVGILVFSTLKDLPECNSKNSDAVVFVSSEKSLYECTQSKWSAISPPPKRSVVVEQSVTEAWRTVWGDWVKSTAYIEVKYGSGGCARYESGSAFLVAPNIMATNGHVVSKRITDSTCGTLSLTEARLWFPDSTNGDTKHADRGSDATLLQVDRSMSSSDDTVLLRISSSGDRNPVNIATIDVGPDHLVGAGPKLGDEILQMGYSSGSTFAHFVTGRINAIQETKNNSGNGFLASLVIDGVIAAGKTVYEYDMITGGGASGGPVFNLKGEVIGINFAGNTKDADTEFGYSVTVKPLRTLMAQSRNWEALAGP